MSATSPAMSSFQSTLEEFLGGGINVQTKSGSGFSTVLDPTTGTYVTNVRTGGATVTAAGAGQTPVPFLQQLQTTSSGRWILLGFAAVIIIAVIGLIRR